MALTTPDTATEVSDRAILDVRASLLDQDVKPAVKGSWINSMIVAFANRVFDFYFALVQEALEALPDTAVRKLERWAAIWGIARTAGVKSTGNTIASGTVASVIDADTILTSGDAREYRVRTAATITTKSLSVSSITRVGAVATVTTAVDHELGKNVLVTITGANEVEYNVIDAVPTIISATVFTVAVTGTPATPATGTILLGFDSATLIVDSEGFGEDEDQAFDAALTFESPISGVDDVTRVDFDAVAGGFDQETDSALRSRYLDKIQNPVGNFNVAQITAVAKSIAGVTRVFVQEITPAVGQVTVYFMRDNDVSTIPDGAEVAEVKAAIDAIKPTNTDTDDVIVSAPTPISSDYTFSAISPDTTTMRDAIEASLEQFYMETPTVGVAIDEDAYRSAIFNTVDPVTGDSLTSFTLTAPPSGDIAIASGEIGVLGNVGFS